MSYTQYDSLHVISSLSFLCYILTVIPMSYAYLDSMPYTRSYSLHVTHSLCFVPCHNQCGSLRVTHCGMGSFRNILAKTESAFKPNHGQLHASSHVILSDGTKCANIKISRLLITETAMHPQSHQLDVIDEGRH